MVTSVKLRPYLAGKRPALDIGRKGRRWRVSLSTRVWRLLLATIFIVLIIGASAQFPQFSHYIEGVIFRCYVHIIFHLILRIFQNASDSQSLVGEASYMSGL